MSLGWTYVLRPCSKCKSSHTDDHVQHKLLLVLDTDLGHRKVHRVDGHGTLRETVVRVRCGTSPRGPNNARWIAVEERHKKSKRTP
jgi:hypothetical protein